MQPRLTKSRQPLVRIAGAALAAVLLGPAASLAQTVPPAEVWRHGATATVAAGVASASSDVNAQTSLSLGWEIAPRVAVEGTAFWIGRANNAGAYAATLSVQANLLTPHRAVPFVEAGFGLYHASFDVSRGTLPSFYAGRVEDGARLAGTIVTFNDPAVLLGAGLNLFVTGRLAIRPEAAVLLAARDSRAYPVTTVAVRAVFHFEEHPVGASR